MNYVLYGLAAAYLIFGAILTSSTMSTMHRRRHPARDWILGTLCMPVLFLAGVVLIACEKLWARLLPLLAYEKPEQMRAGAAPLKGDGEKR